MEAIFKDFGIAQSSGDGYRLARTLTPGLSQTELESVWKSTNIRDAKGFIRRGLQNSDSSTKLSGDELQGWVEVYLAYWKAVGEILLVEEPGTSGAKQSSWTTVYDAWKEMLSALIRGYQSNGFEAWTIPCLYMAGKHLRTFAIRADEQRNSSTANQDLAGNSFQDDFDPETEKHQQLTDCARQLNRVFNLCLSDRAPLEESRKWGIYSVINLLFKTYFKLNQASLSKNVLKVLLAGRGDMPELSAFPRPEQCTFKYYEGVLAFLEEHYVEAEKSLTQAWDLCHRDAIRNKELILTYLIPCHLLTTHTLPSARLLEPYPRLQKLFSPLSGCIKKGQLKEFDLELQAIEDECVKRRIYLTLERGRDIALRNLCRKVFITGGFDEPKEAGAEPIRRTRVPVAEFTAAIRLSSHEVLDMDEVECLLANMIYKNLMKGYIARERGFVVLSKAGAFPGTGV